MVQGVVSRSCAAIGSAPGNSLQQFARRRRAATGQATSMPLLVADGAVAIADGDDLDAALGQFLAGDRADVAEALHDRGGLAGLRFISCIASRMQ